MSWQDGRVDNLLIITMTILWESKRMTNDYSDNKEMKFIGITFLYNIKQTWL